MKLQKFAIPPEKYNFSSKWKYILSSSDFANLAISYFLILVRHGWRQASQAMLDIWSFIWVTTYGHVPYPFEYKT